MADKSKWHFSSSQLHWKCLSDSNDKFIIPTLFYKGLVKAVHISEEDLECIVCFIVVCLLMCKYASIQRPICMSVSYSKRIR